MTTTTDTNYSDLDLKSLIELQVQLADELANLKQKSTVVSKQLDLLRNVIVPERMEVDEIDTITISGIGRVSIVPVMRVSVKSGQTNALQEWLKSHGARELIKPTVNPSTLKAYIAEQIENGEEYPDSLLTIYAFNQARITRTKS